MSPSAFLLASACAVAAAASDMNRLAQEKSPYLAQHKDNPVEWYPWGEDAFARARRENKPIFLSIGYATCHWCHVMERESFADPKTAEVMNRYYVSVKVDREERPDIDKIYMTAATGVGWGGGWPLSIWMTPEGKPFFGGTYFPPEARWGQPGFPALMERIGRMWRERGADMAKDAEKVASALKGGAAVVGREAKPDRAWLKKGFEELARSHDAARGGFGGAPKFPMPAYQAFLLRYWAATGEGRALEMAARTLERMSAGGIYDHVGGGFHRYSTDERWFVPHFEKMLYDNAQLAANFAEAYQAAHNPEFARVARETLDYVLRDMTHPEGGFYSAEDADSVPPEEAGNGGAHPHKAEGAFYLWTRAELDRVLGREAAEAFAFRYGVREGGNVEHDPHGEFGGKNVLFAARSTAETASVSGKSEGELRRGLDESRAKLLKARAKRPRPLLDDKVLASWNGLMISALAKGAQALEEPRYAAAAGKAARFLRDRLYDPTTKRLHHRWRDGDRTPDGIADDYAFLLSGLVDLYEADHDLDWLDWAEELADSMLELFYDKGRGGFFMTASGAGSDLLYRVMEDTDNVEPSASAAAALGLLRLAQLAGRTDLREAAERTLERFGAQLRDQPRSLMHMLQALDLAGGRPRQIVLAGDPAEPGLREMLRVVRSRFEPGAALIVLRSSEERARLAKRLRAVKGMAPVGGKATAYVCFNFACELPTTDVAALGRALDGARPEGR